MMSADASDPGDGKRPPFVTAVILNWNAAEDTIGCASSLLAAAYSNLSIILVDNASTDGSREILASTFPDIPLLSLPINSGYAAGNNAGIRLALERGTDYILVCNDDIVADPSMVSALVGYGELHPEVGIVCAKVYYQSRPREIFSAAGHFNRLMCAGVNRGKLVFRSRDRECLVNYICGAVFLARRQVFEALGFLDERCFMYFEDLEFSRRVATKFQMGYTSAAVAYHKCGAGKGWQTYAELYLYYQTRNRFWVFRKDPLWYRVYVFVFTMTIACAKAIVIFPNLLKGREQGMRQQRALWKGLWDGLRSQFSEEPVGSLQGENHLR